ncbi:MAG: type II toxin-antitoxin system HicA family toxin [Pseudomonadota bacterium]
MAEAGNQRCLKVAKGFYRELTKHLAGAGYVYEMNAKGSHEKWRHAETGHAVTVPRSTKSRHTANEVLKQAGLPKAF